MSPRFSKFKPPQGDDKRPRCTQLVYRKHGTEDCGRLARLCCVAKENYSGNIWLCLGHQGVLSSRGYKVLQLDRRHKKAGTA